MKSKEEHNSEVAFSVPMQIGATVFHTTLTVRASAWWHLYNDLEWGEPPDERPWHVSVSLKLVGLPLGTWTDSLGSDIVGDISSCATEGEAIIKRDRALLTVVRLLCNAGYITSQQADGVALGK